MALLDFPDVFGYTIFCDDIRFETDGKLNFIGTYHNSTMFVHVPFPLILAKFGFAVTLVQNRKGFVPNVGLRIFLPGDPDDAASIQGNLTESSEGAVISDVDARASAIDPAARHPEDKNMIALRAKLIFSPLVISGPGQIRVRAIRNDDIIRLGTLRISSALPHSAAEKATPS
jgi:hypothetical protein